MEGTRFRKKVSRFAAGAGKRCLGWAAPLRSVTQPMMRLLGDNGAQGPSKRGKPPQKWWNLDSTILAGAFLRERLPLDFPYGKRGQRLADVTAGRDKLQTSSGGAWRREAKAVTA